MSNDTIGHSPAGDPAQRPVPLPDVDSAPYWEAATRHELAIQWCEHCECYQFPPLAVCPSCWQVMTWRNVSGRGRVHRYAVSWIRSVPGYEPPFVVADVELEEQSGLLVSANVLDCAPEDVGIDAPVELVFEHRRGGIVVPQFVLSGTSTEAYQSSHPR